MIEKKDIYERLNRIIRLKATGNPKELAEKFNVSESTIYRLINEMKDIGCPIQYDKINQTYYYSEKGNLIINIEFEALENEESKNIIGGSNSFFKLSNFDNKRTYLCKEKNH